MTSQWPLHGENTTKITIKYMTTTSYKKRFLAINTGAGFALNDTHAFPVGTGIVCMINIVVVGLTYTKLTNLANTKVKKRGNCCFY